MINTKILKNALDTYENLSGSKYYQKLNLNEEYQELLKIANRMNGYRFKIVLLGEFSSGKSSILNSLIEEELLPVGILPTTKQFIKVENSEKEYVRNKDNPESELPLSQENIKKLMNFSSEEIEVGKKLPEKLKNYIFYDTPGINDINEFSEKVIFDFLPSADIILFVLDSTQALKKTELDFLTNIVQKKDINKFFFILNKSDLVGEEIESIRKFVINTLNNIFNLDIKLLEDKIILYSAKKTLEAIKKGDNETLLFTGYKLLIEKINDFITNNKVKILEDRIKKEVIQIVSKSLIKINAVIDKIEGKDKEYKEEIQKLEKQIEKFKLQMEKEISKFKSDLRKELDNLKSEIEKSFINIKRKVLDKTDEINLQNPSHQKYIDVMIRSLVENELNKNVEKFIKRLSKLIKNFDNNVFNDLKNFNTFPNYQEIPKMESNNNKFEYLFEAAGAISAPIIAINLLPSLLGGGIIATLIGVTFATSMIMDPKISLKLGKSLGIFSLRVGEATAKFIQWLSGQISTAGEHINNYRKKEEYKKKISKYLDEIKMEILEKINQISPDEFVDKYIQIKFPQKLELEQKKEILKTKRIEEISVIEEEIKVLKEMRKALENILSA